MTSSKRPRQQEATGRIFNIQRFSVHDGPGIRTTVFMKGCPLRCPWCSNPESQDFSPALMARDMACRGCGACVAACPQGAMTITKEAGRRIDRAVCDSCFRCVDVCRYQSLSICGHDATAPEMMEEILRDRAFYRNTGGGVTISGGEALSQGHFVRQLLVACKNEDLHTVLDTSGYAPWSTLEAVLPFVDLLLYDLKHLDTDEHRRTTGVENDLILDNLEKAVQSTTTWLRIPLIAGFNDAPAHIRRIARLGKALGVAKISLLPYHEGGQAKSALLGRPYPWPSTPAISETQLATLQQIVVGEGIKSSIGL